MDIRQKIEQLDIKSLATPRNGLFLIFAAVAFVAAYMPITALRASGRSEYYSHIPLIPLVSLYLLLIRRKQIAACAVYAVRCGIPVLAAALALFGAGQLWAAALDKNNFASLIAFSVLVFVHGGFILTYGLKAYRIALFPLLFLLFMIPIPSAVMDGIIYLLQAGSTEFTNLLFWISGVPYMRDGFVFHLPQVSVEVAKQCSGIRSSLALFITALLAGHLFLKTWWKVAILAAAAVLIAMFKNGIRIITLSLLGNYVDVRILESSLHREGGIPFFIVALLLLAPVLFFLRKTEKEKHV
ncbi:MAG TPA: exosortase/archaeosortase family protein [Smithellaceae bacterium]|nr:exosortase/archaeosortase family protein [Smithellaceae bacterium]